MIQGGDPQGDGPGGPGYSVDEPPPERPRPTPAATVAMAKTAAEPPGRSGSQFFVVTAPADAGPAARLRAGRQGDGGLRGRRGDRGARRGRRRDADRARS